MLGLVFNSCVFTPVQVGVCEISPEFVVLGLGHCKL